jgi:RNA polymerase sigma-70 factor (ECF subfamily)
VTKKIIYRSEPDDQLILNAKNGDHFAFTEIVRRYEQMIYSFAFKVCRNKEKADETLQDTFVNVYRKINQFDGKSKLSTWLYSIVTNNCLMKRRRSKLDSAIIPFEELPEQHTDNDHIARRSSSDRFPALKSSPLDNMMNKELRSVLDKAIIKLPMDYRIVFILRDIEGKSADETAKILNLSIPAVKSRLRRARIFLREQLSKYIAV